MLFFPWSGRFPMSRIWYQSFNRMVLAELAVLGLSGLSAAAQGIVPAATWTQQSPANSPAARQGSMMAYDAARGQVVPFGGLNTSGKPMNDTSGLPTHVMDNKPRKFLKAKAHRISRKRLKAELRSNNG